ncbi:class II fructose-bisphosphate aldolase [Spiroplasma endosymbiont of Virgichneumon dumeticola]|uniref:class II fructose-bisphosphate aldolase n=1 Tax=Spiroplasma endosymbiont of Virgichneumon dumeticola TaxID=3139323 RepID=UPI0035C8D85C
MNSFNFIVSSTSTCGEKSVNNFHGFYPKDWKSLNFDLLQQIAQNCNKPLVLHGGSGIPKNQVLKAIKLGICQVNINSELQLIFAEKLRQEIVNNPYRIIDENTYQTMLANCIHALKKKILSFFIDYGSLGKSINMK